MTTKIENDGIRAMFDPEYLLDEIKKNKKTKIKSFSLTSADLQIIESLKASLAKKMIHVSDSEMVRVALALLSKLSNDEFLLAYQNLERRHAGRPVEK